VTDLTGGLDPASEYVLTERQTTPGMQEGVNWWLWDDQGRFGFPRFAVEAMAPNWDNPLIQMSFVTADGRMMRQWGPAPGHKVIGADGNASHFGAGGLWFDCLEPFAHYRSGFSGALLTGTFEDMLVENFTTTSLAPLRFTIDARPVVPPWIQGTMSGDAASRMQGDSGEALAMGGDRLEQLCRVEGVVNYDGVDRPFTGGALRIRRAGIRKLDEFVGHCWQSAVFPSGKGFGYIAYPGKDGAEYSYNEGYVYLGEGELIPARAVQSPWLRRYRFSGEDVGCVMQAEDGKEYRFGGRTTGGMPSITPADSGFPPLYQALAHYSWDGEQAYGMIERSSMRNLMTMPF